MIRLEKRHTPLRHATLVTLGLSLGMAFVVGALVIGAFGANPLTAYGVMLQGALGSGYGLAEVAVKAIPLTLTGLAVALAATMQLWNIGCEGQFVMGGIGATWAALYLSPFLPPWLVLPAVILCGAVMGMVWALIPAALKVWTNVSEILSTLLLNYVAIIIVEHLYFGPWRDPEGFGFPGTMTFPDEAMLPRLFDMRIHMGILLAIAAALILAAMLGRSKWGYATRVIGLGPRAAQYAGMNVGRNILLVMGISGALAGLAGMGEVSAIHYRLQEGFASGYGFDGIIVACLASLRPLRVPACAVLLGIFLVGGEQLSTAMQLPSSISRILEGALLFGFLLGETLQRYHIRFGSTAKARSVKDGANA
ncbi:ABC transporter permease [Oleidesulfovibrio sp.]|uniref:ABC transporter permease n=1 Tax=Oleidesulfovibrio sp. TaxID=2909707 RepID=UPI003A881202